MLFVSTRPIITMYETSYLLKMTSLRKGMINRENITSSSSCIKYNLLHVLSFTRNRLTYLRPFMAEYLHDSYVCKRRRAENNII